MVINMEKYRIRLVKIGKPSTYKYSVIKVDADKKRRYFIIHTKIYQHEIIETIRFDDCDYIEIFNETSGYGMFTLSTNDKPIKVVNQEWNKH